MTLSEELRWRGLINQTTYKDLTVLDDEPITFYWGVDPSADSMTIGNLAAAMMVKCFMKYDHRPILLIGGATGMIGDPDGKSDERILKSIDEITHNKEAIATQYRQIFGGDKFKLVDNYEWFKDIKYLDFLRDIGKHVPIRQMLARDFIQTRLGDDGSGISYAEFSYVLIQAYDFLHLYKNHNVTLQVCGSDQWGNSIAGVELVRRIAGGEANVYSVPLITNKTTGKKYGKTEDDTIWLDPKKTSPFKFYQFWLNVDDDSVESYLKIFTELDKSTIDETMQKFTDKRESRLAQKTLAFTVTKLVHTEKAANSARQASEVLFGERNFADLGSDDVAVLKTELPVITATSDDLLSHTIVRAGLASSNTEATGFIVSGAIYINGQKAEPDSGASFQDGDNLLKRGKNNFAVVEKSK
ncbi:MAG TPA: tyrosine--tRNA ligase [Candidatus Saccharimonadales bacterium]|nr:tyrosine--tRNA ligase [Candidatus Saccharimonadales bacterium]